MYNAHMLQKGNAAYQETKLDTLFILFLLSLIFLVMFDH
jgi:hypothetical protein